MPEMTYAEYCASKCEGCRRGEPRRGFTFHIRLGDPGWSYCTAPDPEAAFAELSAENARLRNVCGEAYQLAGALGAPVAALDNLSDAASGKPLRHETFLPVAPERPR